ncbi:MAG: carboxypeptidase-like regulatory domain-containing protein [Bacteroidota bacterium]
MSGQIIDSLTNKPIPYVNISVQNSPRGTASNENGEFILPLVKEDDMLIFSHLSYRRDSLPTALVIKSRQIRLVAAIVSLPSVTVGNYAADLIKNAYHQIKKSNAVKYYGKAFYRQTTLVENEATEIQEIIWDAKSCNSQLDGTSINEARYAAKDAPMRFSNFSLYTKIMSIYNDTEDSTTSDRLLNLNPGKYYHLELANIVKDQDNEVAEIVFTSKPNPDMPPKKGIIYIDINTSAVIKYKASIFDMGGGVIVSKSSIKAKNPVWEVEMNFQPMRGALTKLDYIKISFSFDIDRKSKSDKNVKVSSFSFFYDSNQQPLAAIKYTDIRMSKNPQEEDRDLIKKANYNPDFWLNNPVIKRTPLEESIIKSFEEKGSFGTMFSQKSK